MSKKKILIIGLAQSSHTHAWLDLIDRNKFDVRLYGIKNTSPNVLIKAFNYSFTDNFPFINHEPRKNRFWRAIGKIIYLFDMKSGFLNNLWLNRIIKIWQPDIIHTLGLDPAGFDFLKLHQKIKTRQKYRWVVTIRGGSDIELDRFDPEKQKLFRRIFSECDSVIADNKITYNYAYELGLDKTKKPPIDFVPGTGGIDIDKLSKSRKFSTVESRIILWPKACEAVYSKGLPVLEAIKNSWPKIQPCTIIATSVDDNFKKWITALPIKIKQNIQMRDRISRPEFLKLIAQARVVLLPSLIDGIPNSLYEAMACKTCAIVSPIPTIKTIVNEDNVLFARNLYPDEIASQLIQAMKDDRLVDKLIKNNLRLVKIIANRKKISQQINKFYIDILETNK